ncbi:unnamed protein product [Arabidopsis halleri]
MESVSSRDVDVGNLKAPFAAWHFQTALYFALRFFSSRLFLDKFVFHRIAIWLLSTGSSPLKLNDATRVKIVKCKESLWKLLYYAGCEIFVLVFVYPEPWSGDIKLYFDGWPNQELKFFRIGSIILAIHDASDMFMESAKIFKYSGKKVGASLCFGLFAISWFLLRLVFFPFWIIRATIYLLPKDNISYS